MKRAKILCTNKVDGKATLFICYFWDGEEFCAFYGGKQYNTLNGAKHSLAKMGYEEIIVQ